MNSQSVNRKGKLMITQDTVTVYIEYNQDPKTGQPIVLVDPEVARVPLGGTIQFRRIGDMVGKMRLTFEAKQFFETGSLQFSGVLHEDDADLRLRTDAVFVRTTYVCELLDLNENVIARTKGTGGGAVEPVTNNA